MSSFLGNRMVFKNHLRTCILFCIAWGMRLTAYLKTPFFVRTRTIPVSILFEADLTVYYSLSSAFGAAEKYPCLWHRVSSQLKGHFHQEMIASLINSDLPERPTVQARQEKRSNDNWKKGDTFSLLGLRFARTEHSSINFVIPPLHTSLVLINTGLEVLEKLVSKWKN